MTSASMSDVWADALNPATTAEPPEPAVAPAPLRCEICGRGPEVLGCTTELR